MLTEVATGNGAGNHGGDDLDGSLDEIDLFGFTGRWLAKAHRAMRAEADRRLAEAGGNLSTFQVLRAANAGPAPTQVELADALGITGSTLVRHLDRMAADGLIERQLVGADRRIRRIRVTPAGQEMLRRLAAVAVSCERAVVALLSPEDVEVLRHALRTIDEHFGAADAHVHAVTAAS